MKKYFLIVQLFGVYATVYGVLAGGRPNAFSEGNNAFAGVVNPANAVWIKDRFDIGAFWVNQKATLNNKNDNPLLPPGKIDLSYRTRNLFTGDFAIHKQIPWDVCGARYDSSFSLAAYTQPNYMKSRTKDPLPFAGKTPLMLMGRTDVMTAVFSLKLNDHHSIGFTVDYFYFSFLRNGFQNADNPLRSVSPGHVTNKGMDHSSGIGCSVGWRWKITDKLNFGTAWSRKSDCGQFRKYRGYEPYHAHNYTPQSVGAGLSYRFTSRLAGRLEMLWLNLGNQPGANNGVLPDGSPNHYKRGSAKSPGPGLQDTTYINIGAGYMVNEMLSLGMGLSHRIKLPRGTSNILSHTYLLQSIYDILSVGANFKYENNELFLVVSKGFKNSSSGKLPPHAGGGRVIGEKQNASVSLSWGYMY